MNRKTHPEYAQISGVVRKIFATKFKAVVAVKNKRLNEAIEESILLWLELNK